jgi:hypothetical protein
MRRLLILGAILALSLNSFGQEILFDEQVEAGGLKCYPAKGDMTRWYYLPDEPHLVIQDSGRPQFSFLVYARPERSGGEGITRAAGGGVAHFLVAYDVAEDRVRRAASELQRIEPGATLVGPVSYTDGSFALVTSVTDPQAGMSRRVVGVGSAPVMAGHKAAVSMHLTPLGASLLWESFHQSTPDISVAFEMSVSGYLNPVEAKMTIDYEKVHQTMQAQVAGRYGFFAAEVDALVQSMRDNGAITVELTGAPPSQWDAIQKMGLELAKNHLFESQGGTGLASLAAMQQKSSPMDQMWKRYGDEWKKKTSRLQLAPDSPVLPTWLSGHPLTAAALLGAAILTSPQEEVQQNLDVLEKPSGSKVSDADLARAKELFVEAQNLYLAEDFVGAAEKFKMAFDFVPEPAFLFNAAVAFRKADEAESALAHYDLYVNEYPKVKNNIGVVQARDAAQKALSEGATGEKMTTLLESYSKAILNAEEAIKKAAPKSPTPGTSSGTTPNSPSAGETPNVTPKAPASTGSPTGEMKVPPPSATAKPASPTVTPKTPTKTTTAKSPTKKVTPKITPTPKPKADSQTPYGVMVSFKFRRLERTGTFTLNFKQWLRTQRPVRFAENLGDLTGWLDEPSVFRRVNLDDPVFRQREIPVSVDVAGEEAFAAMLNAVTVQLRKVHGSGRETVDEVTIQRQDFASGQPPTLLYGWDGDDDRERWLQYDYRVRWNYVGGPEIEGEWQSTSAGAQVLAPPLRPRELILEADPGFLEEQGVRDVVVEVSYDAAGTERSAHATLRTRAETGEQRLVLYQDPQNPDYTYSFTWRLRGGTRVSAGPFTDTADYVYLDEIPEE